MTHCTALYHLATNCNTLHHTELHTAPHCNTLQTTVTHYNTQQHTATHCYTLKHTELSLSLESLPRSHSLARARSFSLSLSFFPLSRLQLLCFVYCNRQLNQLAPSQLERSLFRKTVPESVGFCWCRSCLNLQVQTGSQPATTDGTLIGNYRKLWLGANDSHSLSPFFILSGTPLFRIHSWTFVFLTGGGPESSKCVAVCAAFCSVLQMVIQKVQYSV